QRTNALMGGSFATPIYQFARKLGFRNIGQPFWGEHPTRTGRATYFATRDVFYSVATGPHSTAPVFCTQHRGISVGRAS
ncbi:MAG TPA: hypothetical protein VFH76_28985, partial [Kribbella sp.]|nr:hypothetical protein [Kribbella sp.]